MPDAFLLPLLLTFTAQQTDVVFDPAATAIHWTLTGNVHTVHGTFHLLKGRVRFDASTGAASGEIVAAASSGESGSGARDKKMHKDVLESARFPNVTFLPKKVRGVLTAAGASHTEMEGIFTLHGTEHSLLIPGEIVITADEVKVKAHFEIPYVEWGLKNPSNFLFKVDPKVAIDLESTGHFVAAR